VRESTAVALPPEQSVAIGWQLGRCIEKCHELVVHLDCAVQWHEMGELVEDVVVVLAVIVL